MIQAIKGTKDILPEESYLWQQLEAKLRALARAYHYEEIRVPTFEETELFVKGTGETTDIVGKEMYTFRDKGERSVTLKPEGTPSVIRAYLEHGLDGKAPLFKAYYLERMYRQEKPQAGRLRQFTQFGAEALGSLDPALDAEMLDMAWKVCEVAGLKQIELKLSSIGCPTCRPAYKAMIKERLLPASGELCGDCKERLEKNPLRVLDCKVEHCKELTQGLPSILDYLCVECKAHFVKVKEYLGDLDIPYVIDTRMVRGLDYYTKTVFELVSTALGARGALPAGGRYDGLVETLGGKPTPGVGFACGIEPLLLAMEKEGVVWKDEESLDFFIVMVGEKAKRAGLKESQKLREMGYSCELDFLSRSANAQMREANRLGAKEVIYLGENEFERELIPLRDMQKRTQKDIEINEFQFRKELQYDPNNAKACYFLGRYLWRLGKYDRAVLEFQRALTLNPNYLEAYLDLAQCYEEQGKRLLARTILTDALEYITDKKKSEEIIYKLQKSDAETWESPLFLVTLPDGKLVPSQFILMNNEEVLFRALKGSTYKVTRQRDNKGDPMPLEQQFTPLETDVQSKIIRTPDIFYPLT